MPTIEHPDEGEDRDVRLSADPDPDPDAPVEPDRPPGLGEPAEDPDPPVTD